MDFHYNLKIHPSVILSHQLLANENTEIILGNIGC